VPLRDDSEPAPPPRPPARSLRGLVVAAGAAVATIAVALTLFVWRPWAPPRQELEGLGLTPADSTLRLDVETVPEGAQVMLPATGETRLSPTWFENLKPGPTRVRVSLAGYLTRDTVLDLETGAPGALRVELVSLASTACTLFVVVSPRADEVLVDGLAATRVDSSAWFLPVGPGTHSVDVSATGYEKWSKVAAAKVAAGANARVRVSLRPGVSEPVATETTTAAPIPAPPVAAQGGARPWQAVDGTRVTVECDPEGQLFVDDVPYPTLVRRTELSMAPGNHSFRFTHPDYVDMEQTKRLKRGQKTEHVRNDFRAGSGILSISSSNGSLQVFVRGQFRGYTPLVVREVKTGRCLIELRDRSGGAVVASREVKVANSSKPLQVRF